MLDQNVTTLLSTLLGGILTIVGGFVAAIYVQKKTNTSEKKKYLREKLEELFIINKENADIVINLVNSLNFAYYHNNKEFKLDNYPEILAKINSNWTKSDAIVFLYFPQFEDTYIKYTKCVNNIILNIEIDTIDIDILIDYEKQINKLEVFKSLIIKKISELIKGIDN